MTPTRNHGSTKEEWPKFLVNSDELLAVDFGPSPLLWDNHSGKLAAAPSLSANNMKQGNTRTTSANSDKQVITEKNMNEYDLYSWFFMAIFHGLATLQCVISWLELPFNSPLSRVVPVSNSHWSPMADHLGQAACSSREVQRCSHVVRSSHVWICVGVD